MQSTSPIEGLVESLRSDERFVHLHRDLPREARHEGPPLPRGYSELWTPGGDGAWSHQREALAHIDAGESVVISTPTSSGKSLCYQLPALEAASRGATSLVIYPTKALAHDQLTGFARLAPEGVVVAAYDGDCTPTERAAVRSDAKVVLTNPEMLHLGILANHRGWDRFLNRLELVVPDELHTMRGVFGSHVAHVLRRLRRLTALRRGREPQFVFTSATIGRPEELAAELAGVPVHGVADSGAPVGPRSTVLWNPQVAARGEPGAAGSAPSLEHESASIATEAVCAGLRTLVFCRSRRASERTADLVREQLRARRGPDGAEGVRSYRAGYLAQERREIETDLESGNLECVVATSALELGIDISGMDAVVVSGFPGTFSSFTQRAGRVGRGSRPALVVLVAGQDQLDQWVMAHPRELFRRPPEPVVINPANPHVLLPHIGCAADEAPVGHGDYHFWGDDLDEAVTELAAQDRLRITRPGTGAAPCGTGPLAVWSGRGAPAPSIGLRAASAGEFRIRSAKGTDIGTVDAARLAQVAHRGAVYLHQGRAWRVVEVDPAQRTASVEPHDGSTYTSVRSETSIVLESVDDTTSVGSLEVFLGRVVVTTKVVAYEEREVGTRRFVKREPLEMAPSELDTTALWWRFDPSLVQRSGIQPEELPGALHAAEHAGIGMLPLFALCDRWDLGGVSSPWLAETAAPTVVIHDAYPGGAGAAPMAFRTAESHLRATLEVISACECSRGCPGCVQSPKCGNGNEPLDKQAAQRLLETALDGAAST